MSQGKLTPATGARVLGFFDFRRPLLDNNAGNDKEAAIRSHLHRTFESDLLEMKPSDASHLNAFVYLHMASGLRSSTWLVNHIRAAIHGG